VHGASSKPDAIRALKQVRRAIGSLLPLPPERSLIQSEVTRDPYPDPHDSEARIWSPTCGLRKAACQGPLVELRGNKALRKVKFLKNVRLIVSPITIWNTGIFAWRGSCNPGIPLPWFFRTLAPPPAVCDEVLYGAVHSAALPIAALLFTGTVSVTQSTMQKPLLENIATGKTRVIDLTYALSDKLVPWPGDAKAFEAQVNATLKKTVLHAQLLDARALRNPHGCAGAFPAGNDDSGQNSAEKFFGPAVILDEEASPSAIRIISLP